MTRYFKDKLINLCNIKKLDLIEFYFEKIYSININTSKNINIKINNDNGVAFRNISNNELGVSIVSLQKKCKNNLSLISNIINNSMNGFRKKLNYNMHFSEGQNFNTFLCINKKIAVNNMLDIIIKNFPRNKYNVNLQYVQKKFNILTYTSDVSDYCKYVNLIIYNLKTNKSTNYILPNLDKINDIILKDNYSPSLKKQYISKKLVFEFIMLSEDVNSLFISILGNCLICSDNQLIDLKKYSFSKMLSLYDNGCENFSLYPNYDSEGIKKKKTCLIKNGQVNSYLYNLEFSSIYNKKPTGNAFRKNFKYLPRTSSNFLVQSSENITDFMDNINNKELIILEKIYYDTINLNLYNGNFSFKCESRINNQYIDIIVQGNIIKMYNHIIKIGNYDKVKIKNKFIKCPRIILDRQALKIIKL